MNRPQLISFLFCCMLGSWPLRAQYAVSRVEAINMVDQLTEKLLRHHPFAQDTSGAALVDSVGRRITAQLSIVGHDDSLSFLEFLATVAPLQRITRDGHLQLIPDPGESIRDSIDQRSFPIYLSEMNDGSFVLRYRMPTTTGDTIPMGTRVLAMDGWRAQSLINQLASFAGVNDNGFDRAARFHTALNFGRNYQRVEGWRDSISVLVSSEDGRQQLHWVKPQRPSHDDQNEVEDDESLARRIFNLRKSEDSSAWIMRVRSFSSEVFGGNRGFRKIAREYFTRINASGIDRLVIDLRFNTGGSLANCSYLYGFLAESPFPALTEISSTGPTAGGEGIWNRFGLWLLGGVRKRGGTYVQPSETKRKNRVPEKKRYRGEVIVLTNNMTFSAAGLFANYVQGYERGKIVGDISGASNEVVYGGQTLEFPVGERQLFTLKMKNWRLVPANPKPGNITPDIIVPVGVQDLLSGRKDPQLSRALAAFSL